MTSAVLLASGWAFLLAGWGCEYARWRRGMEPFWAPGLFTACNGLFTAWFMLDGDTGFAVFPAACAVISAWLAWHHWRRRRRLP